MKTIIYVHLTLLSSAQTFKDVQIPCESSYLLYLCNLAIDIIYKNVISFPHIDKLQFVMLWDMFTKSY